MVTNNLPFCKCGCGQRVSKPGNSFLNHHYVKYKNPMKDKRISEKVRKQNIGRKKTEEEIEKLRISCKGINKGEKNGMFGVTGERHPSFGIPKSEEHRNKLKQAALERGLSGKNNPMYGRKHTEKTRRRQSEIKKGITWEQRSGKERARELKQMAHDRISGSNHPNWHGGCTEDGYCEEWRTQELKDYIKERDQHTCQNLQCNCNSRICIHHINYNKKDCDPHNLIVLCFSCNSKANFDRDWWQSYYTEIIRRKYKVINKNKT